MTYPQQRIFPSTAETIALLYREGKTLEQLDYFFGVSRERIRQLIEGRVSSDEGGVRVRSRARLESRKLGSLASRKKVEETVEKAFGCMYEEVTQINGFRWTHTHREKTPRCKASIYWQQKRNAAMRGIEWRLTFPAWWAIWSGSGKWGYRGRGKYAYCMSRTGDAGAYALGNVIIQTNSSNASQGRRRKLGVANGVGLTPREKQVLDLCSQGLTPSQVGQRLGLRGGYISVIKVNATRRLRNMEIAPQ